MCGDAKMHVGWPNVDEKQVEMLNEQYSDIFLNGNGGKWKWGENGSGVFLFPENR